MIIFSRKTHGCWVPPFLETSIYTQLHHQLGLIPSPSQPRSTVNPLQAMPVRRSVSSPCGTNSVTRRSSSRESKGCCNDSRGRSGKWVSPALGGRGYTPVNKRSNGKSPFSIGNTSSKGLFSIAMLVYQRVLPGKRTVENPENPNGWFRCIS